MNPKSWRRNRRNSLLADVFAANRTWEGADRDLQVATTEDEVVVANKALMGADELLCSTILSARLNGVSVRRVARVLGCSKRTVEYLLTESPHPPVRQGVMMAAQVTHNHKMHA